MSVRTEKRATWPTSAEASARMRNFKAINLRRALTNPNENWMADHLCSTGLKWSRQAQWGFRLFDFWCSEKGVAVEVDGAEHDKGWDAFRDRQDYERSGIVVLRVRNRNEEDAARALAQISKAGSWNSRRKGLGLKSLGAGHIDRYELPPKVRSSWPRHPPAPRPEPERSERKPPQARCSECGTRIRTRRPAGSIRCKCGKSTAPQDGPAKLMVQSVPRSV